MIRLINPSPCPSESGKTKIGIVCRVSQREGDLMLLLNKSEDDLVQIKTED